MNARTLKVFAALYVAALAASFGDTLYVIHKSKVMEAEMLGLARRGTDLARFAEIRRRDCDDRLRESGAVAAAMEKVGSIPYSNPGMNCYDHSKALVNALADAGVTSSILINSDRSHAWVAVWVEANTGRFVPLSQTFGPVLEVRDRSLRVICSAKN